MALGGVATGNIKAQDAEKVAGIINIRGFICMDKDTDAKIGRIIWVEAVFDVNSVKKVIVRQSRITIKKGETPASPVNLFPINAESPVV